MVVMSSQSERPTDRGEQARLGVLFLPSRFHYSAEILHVGPRPYGSGIDAEETRHGTPSCRLSDAVRNPVDVNPHQSVAALDALRDLVFDPPARCCLASDENYGDRGTSHTVCDELLERL